MKYMVLVNGKWFIQIEIDGSALAAEHFFLNEHDGVHAAQAFDAETMSHKWFITDWLLNYECISYDEFKRLETEYKESFVALSCAKDARRDVEYKIEDLENQLVELNRELDVLMKAERDANARANDAVKAMGRERWNQ